jgi:chemotaxis protein histidine kinase CheA
LNFFGRAKSTRLGTNWLLFAHPIQTPMIVVDRDIILIMPADDHPFAALEKQLEMEALSLSPVTRTILNAAAHFKWPFNKAAEILRARLVASSSERISLMLETCMAEVRKHDSVIKELSEKRPPEEVKAREEISTELLLDAARKAENTRAQERVKRIGLILANAVLEPKRTDADEAEEMMRIAMELSDRDVYLLGELARVEGTMLETQAHIPRYAAHQAWERGPWGTRIDSEIDSVFSKLESYGLVSRIPPPNNLNIMADYQNRYVLLRKGLRFVMLAITKNA